MDEPRSVEAEAVDEAPTDAIRRRGVAPAKRLDDKGNHGPQPSDAARCEDEMATFTVHVPPGIADAAVRAEKTAFVRDGFSLRAFLLGPVFLVYHRLWRATLLWIVAAVVVTVLARGLALPAPAGIGLYLVLALLTGLETGQARQAAYGRRGYIGAAVLAGVRRDGAERRFYDAEVSGRLPPLAQPSRTGGALHAEPVIGLFPQPGGRR